MDLETIASKSENATQAAISMKVLKKSQDQQMAQAAQLLEALPKVAPKAGGLDIVA